MPTPDRTSLEAIVAAARTLLRDEGLPGVTMHAVAARVGVRAPSLYKRVESREALIRLVAETALAELIDLTHDAATLPQALRDLRNYGVANPEEFTMVMAPGSGVPTASTATYAASATAILRLTAELAGDADALVAARVAIAWAMGFITMEIKDRFHLGGDVDAAWEFGLDRLVVALSRTPPG